jgi:RND family efflux transporter MFP subunit
MHRRLKIFLPIVIILVGVLTAWQLMANSPKAQRKGVTIEAPLVQTMKVSPQDVRIPIMTQGTVTPRTSIALSAEISGRIIETSSSFAKGGFFRKGDVLLRIDPEEYKLAITRAEATLATAKQLLAQAKATYQQKQKEYSNVNPDKVSDFALRKPEYEEAKAKLKAAQADLQLARLNLSHCEIRAPFDGRISDIMADIGQYTMPGGVVAKLFAIDTVEIRLPVTQSQARLLNLSALSQTDIKPDNYLPVTLRGQYAGKEYQWQGNIVRTDATIDDRNRLLYLIAQVKDPYGMHEEKAMDGKTQHPAPLAAGMFVKAEIPGREMQNIFVLPRTAIHEQNTVWLLDEALKLHQRQVAIIHRDDTHAYITDGLQAGDTIIISPLDAVVDGMQLRVSNT